ncbi:HTH domain-containing protein [Hoeflea sp.]|uniref:HTH domain-containing protein n=1 Tax=Hoeflea sp. TaxID=1940281 RepID=UPI003748A505
MHCHPVPGSVLSRAARLLDLLQVFRRYKRPVSGAALAGELGVSLRAISCGIGSRWKARRGGFLKLRASK